ncbi:AAA family ATPase [Candidatus Woesearchaeota archaeon]|nr:AAA family ATPase [Candidatus Woesearchaeota archaeon]
MHKHKLIAIVGLAGAGKTEVARFFELAGFVKIRFGDLTQEYLQQNNLEVNEHNERNAREFLRKKHGMAAYAKLNLGNIQKNLESNHVVIDGLYSWEEYKFLKHYIGEQLHLLAIYASPELRHIRLNTRHLRPLDKEEAESRDIAEIEHLNKAGPIAYADHTIVNTTTIIDLREKVHEYIKYLIK